jgi:membrane protein DedA with SNARE-associated domain
MMSFFQNWLLPLLRDHGLLIVFLTMVAESACIPIPSEIVVPYGGFLAATGNTQLWAVIVVATLANVVGSGIAYGVGRFGGRALFVKYGRYVLVRPHHLDKADRWFERRGELTVFFTRMMPGVRTFISLPAGIAKMPASSSSTLFWARSPGTPLWLTWATRRARRPGGKRPTGPNCRSSSAATTTSSTSCLASSWQPSSLGQCGAGSGAASGSWAQLWGTKREPQKV